MRPSRLTRREQEVARLVIDGLSSQDIAAALFISVHTARDHLEAMFGRVGVSRRQDLVAVLTGRTPPQPMLPKIASEALGYLLGFYLMS